MSENSEKKYDKSKLATIKSFCGIGTATHLSLILTTMQLDNITADQELGFKISCAFLPILAGLYLQINEYIEMNTDKELSSILKDWFKFLLVILLAICLGSLFASLYFFISKINNSIIYFFIGISVFLLVSVISCVNKNKK